MQQLQGYISGLCIPSYVIDLPQGGKVKVTPENIIEETKTHLKIKNYQEKIFLYKKK